MEDRRLELQRAIVALGPRGRGRPYPRDLLAKLIAYTAARREQGAKLLEIGNELGISWRSLSRWLAERAISGAGFQPVRVAQPRPSHVVVRGPHGIVIEGLDLEGIAELVQRLDG
jgi:hypothetical protein